MIPDYQTLMRSVPACASAGETRIGDAVERLANKLALTPQERAQMLPSGKQTSLPSGCTGPQRRPRRLLRAAATTPREGLCPSPTARIEKRKIFW
jgi:restriction endonuclease Mrr